MKTAVKILLTLVAAAAVAFAANGVASAGHFDDGLRVTSTR